jgi:hypothetical protein
MRYIIHNAMIISGLCHYALCIRVWSFTSLCMQFVVYFDSIIVTDGQIAIMDFEIMCNLQQVN